MDKHIKHGHAPTVLLVFLLMYFATHAQCRITEDVGNMKINLPAGLCAYKSQASPCLEQGYCICCLVTDYCYDKMDDCIARCNQLSRSAPARNPPLPSRKI
uniref:Uncharacterized protein n=1 Tax=Avena sativa TaxID=4498 RepID=A0ACD5Y9M6_AVESA